MAQRASTCREPMPVCASAGAKMMYCHLSIWHAGAHQTIQARGKRVYRWDNGSRAVRVGRTKR